MKSLKTVGLCMILCLALATPAAADTVDFTGSNTGVLWFMVTNTGGNINADTRFAATNYDTILTAFDLSGNVITFNDDAGFPCGHPNGWCSNINWAGSGTFIIGLSRFSNFATGANFNYEEGWFGATGGTYYLRVSGLGVTSVTQIQDPNAVPEPATLALLGTGLVGAALRRRKLKVA